jgi:hypothetical protein
VLLRFCHRFKTQVAKPLLKPSLDPQLDPGWERCECDFDASGWERAGEGPPFAGGDPSPRRVSFLRANESPKMPREIGTRHLWSSRDGVDSVETPPSLQPLPLRDRRTFV